MNELQNTSANYIILVQKLGHRIEDEMNKRKMGQTDLARLTGQSQPSISNIIQGKDNVSMKKIFSVMEALGMDPLREISRCIDKEPANGFQKAFYDLIHNSTQNFIYDPNHEAFNGITPNIYHTYFHSTNRNEKGILHGELTFGKEYGHCSVELHLFTKSEDNPDSYIIKDYKGYAFISLSQHALYIILINPAIGEMCFLIFPYNQILNKGKHLECTMGTATTISSGIDSRLPTIHRIFLSRKEIPPEMLPQIGAQLLLNKSLIHIPTTSFDKLCEEKKLSPRFLECFNQHKTAFSCYEIDEDFFKHLLRKDPRYFLDLCLLREHSTAPENNKINETSISNIYRQIIRKIH